MIKYLGIDVDGTMTDGGVYADQNGNESLRFSRIDGHGIQKIKEYGLEVFALSGEYCESAYYRCKKLDISYYAPYKNKRKYIKELQLNFDELAYIGDDINDLDVIRSAKLSGCPKNSGPLIQLECDYVCQNYGGSGAVREFCEFVIKFLRWHGNYGKGSD